MQDNDFKKLLKEIGTEQCELAESAESDALAMMAKIQPTNPNPVVSAYQLLLINEELKNRINIFSLVALVKLVESNTASERASLRHVENRSMKKDVFNWLDTNMQAFNSMDAAAQAVTKQQPIAFRTARSWVGDWKKLRSAGTP